MHKVKYIDVEAISIYYSIYYCDLCYRLCINYITHCITKETNYAQISIQNTYLKNNKLEI